MILEIDRVQFVMSGKGLLTPCTYSERKARFEWQKSTKEKISGMVTDAVIIVSLINGQ